MWPLSTFKKTCLCMPFALGCVLLCLCICRFYPSSILHWCIYIYIYTYIGQFYDCPRIHKTIPKNMSKWIREIHQTHYSDVIMSAKALQITSLMIVYWTVYSGADQRKHQSSASLAFVRGINRWPVNSRHKGSVTRKMFPFDDVIMSGKWTR